MTDPLWGPSWQIPCGDPGDNPLVGTRVAELRVTFLFLFSRHHLARVCQVCRRQDVNDAWGGEGRGGEGMEFPRAVFEKGIIACGLHVSQVRLIVCKLRPPSSERY